MMQRLGLDVQAVDVEWGEGAPPEQIQQILSADKAHAIQAVAVVHNETATGVTSDIAAVRKAIDAAGHPALLFVDGVSSIASLDFRMDEWGVDMAVCGSQKGLMLPAGLGIICASQKALARTGAGEAAPGVLRPGRHDQGQRLPGISPIRRRCRCCMASGNRSRILAEEGLENVFARHHRLAEGTRAAVKAWGLSLCAKAPKWYSDTVSAILVPPGFNGADVIDVAYRRYSLALGAGLNKVAGKLFRIGHLGDLNELMLISGIAGAEMAMRDVGIQVTPGSGLAAAEEYWRSTATPCRRNRPAAVPDAAKTG